MLLSRTEIQWSTQGAKEGWAQVQAHVRDYVPKKREGEKENRFTQEGLDSPVWQPTPFRQKTDSGKSM